jgi:pre-mRNA-processing factor 40
MYDPAENNGSDDDLPTSTSETLKGPISQQREEPVWKEYKDTQGRVYYHNRLTKVSQWDKPEDFDKPTSSAPLDLQCDWKEYKTEEGRLYYHNAKVNVTQWNCPDEYKAYLEKKQMNAYAELSRDELKDAFKKLIRTKGILITWSQDQAIQSTRDDALSKLLKMSEKKQCYQSLMQDLKNEEIEEKRKKERKAEDDFIQAILDCSKIHEDTTFREAMLLIATDVRSAGIPSERERERLYGVAGSQRKAKAKEEAKLKKKEFSSRFMQYLKENDVSAQTSWLKIYETGKDTPYFKNLGNYDCLLLFIEYVTKLEKEEREVEKKEESERAAKSRKVRDNWRDLLEEYKSAKKITSNSRWKQFRPLVKDDDRYIAMLGDVDGSTPVELFYDLIDDMIEEDQKQCKQILRLAKDYRVDNIRTIDYYQLKKEIPSLMEFKFFDANWLTNFQEKMKADEMKEKRRARKLFNDDLQRARITRSCTFEKLKNYILRDEVDQALDYLVEDEVIEIFNEHMKELALQDDFETSAEEGEFSDDSIDRKKSPSRRSPEKKKGSRKRSEWSDSMSDEFDDRRKRRKDH